VIRRWQYAEDGLAGLEGASRPGGPKSALTEEAIAEILSATRAPPRDALRENGVTLVSAAAGGLAAPHQEAPGQPRLDQQAVAAVLPAAAPHRTEVQVLHRPTPKVGDVVGLYLNPPDNAAVV
jgi:hypothetical protein